MLARKTFVSIGVWILCLTGITLMAIFYNSYDLAKLPNDVCVYFILILKVLIVFFNSKNVILV